MVNGYFPKVGDIEYKSIETSKQGQIAFDRCLVGVCVCCEWHVPLTRVAMVWKYKIISLIVSFSYLDIMFVCRNILLTSWPLTTNQQTVRARKSRSYIIITWIWLAPHERAISTNYDRHHTNWFVRAASQQIKTKDGPASKYKPLQVVSLQWWHLSRHTSILNQKVICINWICCWLIGAIVFSVCLLLLLDFSNWQAWRARLVKGSLQMKQQT